MFQPRPDSHSSNNLPPILPSPRKRQLLTRRRLFVLVSLSVLVSLLLLSQVLSNWSFLAKWTYASNNAGPTGGLTYQQFASEGRSTNVYHGPAVIPANSPSRLKPPKGPFTDYSKLPPSAEPPTMKPVSMPLDATRQQVLLQSRLICPAVTDAWKS